MTDHSCTRQITRQSGSNFYFSFFSLPRKQREAITAVYAFCRQVDDVTDTPGIADPAAELDRWRQEMDQTYDGKPSWPLTRSLLDAIDGFHLTKTYFDGIIDGVAMDLHIKRYATFKDLEQYCYHVAGEVGLLCMEIFGYRSERLKSYAVNLGMAFQLTNILRDVKTDAGRDRIYIPQEDLKRFGVEESWILQGEISNIDQWKAFQRLMAFEVRRAQDYYRKALVLPTVEERPALRAAEIMRAIYSNLLDRIEARKYNVFSGRIRVPTPVKLGLAVKTWWECR